MIKSAYLIIYNTFTYSKHIGYILSGKRVLPAHDLPAVFIVDFLLKMK